MSCPCSSGKPYDDCCKPFHEGKIAENALQLMRARFAAYALSLPAYIMQTTHPASPQYCENARRWEKQILDFSQSTTFKNLEVLDYREFGEMALVTFVAHLFQDGRDLTFTEKSHFERRKSRWLYRGGQLFEGRAPNLITTEQVRLLPLAYYGEPILKRKAEPVAEIDDALGKLVAEMEETLDACNGLGLAAPQVHQSIRLFLIREPIEKKGPYDVVQWGATKPLINPEILSSSVETWRAPEGCLSIPTLRAEVVRPKEITVEYTTLEGERVRETCRGWRARVIQHEYDHINGILFIDRLSARDRKKIEPVLQRIQQRLHDGIEM